MSEENAYTQGGRHALLRAARFARKAEKNRTYDWLVECADIWEQSWDGQWPDAPAYKGPVVHIEAPGPDLKELTADQLDDLLKAVENEQFEREND